MSQDRRLTKEDIKSDQFVDSTLQVYEFLKENLKSIIIGATIVILVVGGICFLSAPTTDCAGRSLF